MNSLTDKIKSMMESDFAVVDSLDINELHFVNNLMNELNVEGKHHTISKIGRSEEALDVETKYIVTYIKK